MFCWSTLLFASGDESDIEEDEPDEPSHVSNNSMSHFSDENNAILAAAAISEWSEPASEAESTKAQAEANAADPHQLKRSSGCEVVKDQESTSKSRSA